MHQIWRWTVCWKILWSGPRISLTLPTQAMTTDRVSSSSATGSVVTNTTIRPKTKQQIYSVSEYRISYTFGSLKGPNSEYQIPKIWIGWIICDNSATGPDWKWRSCVVCQELAFTWTPRQTPTWGWARELATGPWWLSGFYWIVSFWHQAHVTRQTMDQNIGNMKYAASHCPPGCKI